MHLLLALALFATALSQRDTYVVHEKRSDHQQLQRRHRVQQDAIVPVRIGLTQSNLEKGYDYVMEVADPDSPNYGKHWTVEQVTEAFAPSNETVEAVLKWLHLDGIDVGDVIHSDNKGWLALDVEARKFEELLRTELYEYEHDNNSRIGVGCDRYHVPADIQPHIDYITPGVKISYLKKRRLEKRGLGMRRRGPFMVKVDDDAHGNLSSTSLKHCGKRITPACIRALYNVPLPSYPQGKPDPTNKLGIFEDGDYYVQLALNQFYGNFTPYIPQGTAPILKSVDGGVAPIKNVGEYGYESLLDFELAYPLIYPQQINLYQVDDRYWARVGMENDSTGFYNTMLDALDGSYCTYSAYGETGDAPFDPKYPDHHKGGYKGKLQCGIFKPPNVLSTSYLVGESSFPGYYLKRQCNEFMKLSLQGTSFLFASGDSGVGSDFGCIDKTGHLNEKKGYIFAPETFTCPYVTVVGGTALYPGQSIDTPESAAEIGGFYASGGGFSNLYPQPKYQQAAVQNYLEKYKPPYESYAHLGLDSVGKHPGLFNRKGRAFPDVAAISARIGVCVPNHCKFYGGGTSAATPIFSSLINRIIQERANVGKGPLGFLNPVFYKHPELFNDIVNGSNPGCGTKGFKTAPGWDPVTGMGTPKYPEMLRFFMSLP